MMSVWPAGGLGVPVLGGGAIRRGDGETEIAAMLCKGGMLDARCTGCGDFGCMPPRRVVLRMRKGILDMNLSGMSGGCNEVV